jgi:bleomycin hydrolase
MKRQIILATLLLSIFSSAKAQTDSFSQKEEFITIIENPTTSVKDQGGPVCWSYATCSFIESELLRMKKGAYDLSEDFFVYYAYIDKAHNYVLRKGNTSFGPGGLTHDVLRIIKEKGIIPQQYFKVDSIQNDRELERVLRNYLKTILEDDYPTENWMKHYCALLDSYYNSLPNQFDIKGQSYTPTSFAKFLEINPDDYVSLTSYTHHFFYTNFALEVRDNYASGMYFNVPLNEFIQTIDSSLVYGYTVVWDGDMSETFSYKRNGLALLPIIRNEGIKTLNTNTPELNVDQRIRQLSFERLLTTDNHLMHIIGIAKNGEGKKFYIVKNSYGTKDGPYNGYIYMSEAYLKMQTVSIVLNKNALPKEIRKRMDK